MIINNVKTKQLGEEGGGGVEVCNGSLLKYWPVARVAGGTPGGLSQHDIKKAALYRRIQGRGGGGVGGGGVRTQSVL